MASDQSWSIVCPSPSQYGGRLSRSHPAGDVARTAVATEPWPPSEVLRKEESRTNAGSMILTVQNPGHRYGEVDVVVSAFPRDGIIYCSQMIEGLKECYGLG